MKRTFFGISIHSRREVIMLMISALQSFFIGAFTALFSIGAHVLFLQSWEPSTLPQAFILSGAWGIILFTVYSMLSSRLRITTFVPIVLFFVFILNTILYLNYDNIVNYNISGIPLMFPFVLAIPLPMLVLVLFRKSLRGIFSPEQHRRFYPLIRSSLMAGIIVSSYALVGSLYIHWDMLLIIAASAVFIGLAAFLQLPVGILYRSSGWTQPLIKRSSQLRSKFYELFYTRYTLLLVFFVLISAITGFILHYHFVAETRENYANTIGLAKFFGFFTGTMFLFVYGVEKFLVRKILYSYDSPYSLVLIPVVLICTSLAAIAIDLLFGTTTLIARFSFGFMMVAMLKIGYETTYESIELPSLRVLFRTVDLRFSNALIPRFEGSFRMLSLLLAGLALAGLFMLHLESSLFLNLSVLILSIIWLPVSILLVKSYQNALRETIRRLKTSKKAIEQELLNTDEKTHGLINSKNPVKTINTLSLVEKLEPLSHEKHLVSLLGTDSPELRNYLLERIEENALLSSFSKLKELQLEGQQKHPGSHLPKLLNRFEMKFNVGLSQETIQKLTNSKNLTDRILAAELIGNSGNRDFGDFLLHLHRDIEPDVKLAAVKAMARLAHPDHSYILIGYLTTPVYYSYAFESLVRIGDAALPYMEQAFLLPDADNILLSRIVRIYGKIGTQAAIEFLLGKIENQNRTIVRQTLLALREAKFQATPGNINRILNDIVRLINTMSWNFAAYSSINRSSRFSLLQEALESEIADNYNTLYHLLSLAYNPTSIGNIKNMLLEGNDTDISFAIELLDQIVNEEIKQVFFPVVENIPVKERFKQLQYFFQAVRELPGELIQDIINRDFNLVSLYAKSCAIYSLPILHKQEASQELVASVFHPNQLIRETAAYVMEQIEPLRLESVFSRLDPVWVNEIKSSLSHSGNGIPYLLLHRIRFIKNCRQMKGISEDILLEISKVLDVNSLTSEEEFLIKRDDVHYAFMIIIEGTAQIKISSGKVFTFDKNDIIYSDIFVEDNTFSLRALTDLRMYSLEQEALNSLMFDYIDFRNAILDIVEEA
jgi:ATP:ADP antiporter, AAA family